MKALLALILMSWLSLASAEVYSMRRCVLLPVTDSVGGAIASKVYEEIERYLKEESWCHYEGSHSLISVFSRYRENLATHLKTKEVLRTVADKLKTGSILRVNLVSEINGMEIQLDIVGENGEDIYYSEKSLLPKDNIELIVSTLQGWLDLYAKLIPYDAKITGILGDQITLDVGRGFPIKIGQEFTVKRFVNSKKHPLLKKVVEWEAKPMATGKVFNISDEQALGVIKVYKDDQKLATGDWVRLESVPEDKTLETLRYPETNQDSFGKLGHASFYLTGAKGDANVSGNGSRRIGGMLLGFNARGEGWITRNYFAALEFARNLGTLKKSSGTMDKKSVDSSFGVFKFSGGYKYLPLGFFYGPQVDFYAGYSNYIFNLDYSATDGYGESSFTGIHLGVAANIPVGKEWRAHARAEFIPFPTFDDNDSLYGSTKSESLMQLEFGGKYQYTNAVSFDALVELTSAKATFGGTFRSASYRQTLVKLGTSFSF